MRRRAEQDRSCRCDTVPGRVPMRVVHRQVRAELAPTCWVGVREEEDGVTNPGRPVYLPGCPVKPRLRPSS